jgi:hypothetical protein
MRIVQVMRITKRIFASCARNARYAFTFSGFGKLVFLAKPRKIWELCLTIE